ncbi:MAG: helix-turn-helix domain-containing protein [Lachnospiraceae bacterium]|nr:helix-turn-helix domain-containing protein [Lachnospiraceae bacterium]
MDPNSKVFYQAVGMRIRSLRQKKRYTAEELAEMAGISAKYLYQIEYGNVGFSTEILYKIARSLEVTTDFLLSENQGITQDKDLSVLLSSATKEVREHIKDVIMNDILSRL